MRHKMSDLFDDFLRRRRTEKAPGTYLRDLGKVRNHLGPGLGHLDVEDLTEDILRDFLYDLTQKPRVKPTYDPVQRLMVPAGPNDRLLGLSPLRDTYTVLNLVLKDAISHGYIRDNPLAGIKRASRYGVELEDASAAFRGVRPTNGALSESESRQFLLAFLGLRQGERLGTRA